MALQFICSFLIVEITRLTALHVCRAGEQHFEPITIPDIDISSFVSGDSMTQSSIANTFDFGFHKYGIVRVINHGIPSDLINDIFAEMNDFFHDSREAKMEYNRGEFGASGYIPRDGESFYVNPESGDKRTEPTESFHFVANYSDTYSMQLGRPYYPSHHDNGLPSHFSEYKISKYYQQLRKLLKIVHKIASLALGYEDDINIFESKMNDDSFLGLRMTYYYELPSSSQCVRHLRLSAHRDFAGFGLIQNDALHAGGFQIQYNNTFYDVAYVPNSLLIIGGDFIRFFTNDYWKSNWHRVLTRSERERFTMIGFSGTDLTEQIDIFPGCTACNAQPRKFNPVTGKEWLLKRVHDANAMNDFSRLQN